MWNLTAREKNDKITHCTLKWVCCSQDENQKKILLENIPVPFIVPLERGINYYALQLRM